VDISLWKIRPLRPGLNPRTCVSKAGALTTKPPKTPGHCMIINIRRRTSK
jgi:hypothetical protein